MTSTVEMAPDWPVGLCIVKGLTPVEVAHGGSRKFPEVCVLCVLAHGRDTVVITLLGYTCANYGM